MALKRDGSARLPAILGDMIGWKMDRRWRVPVRSFQMCLCACVSYS